MSIYDTIVNERKPIELICVNCYVTQNFLNIDKTINTSTLIDIANSKLDDLKNVFLVMLRRNGISFESEVVVDIDNIEDTNIVINFNYVYMSGSKGTIRLCLQGNIDTPTTTLFVKYNDNKEILYEYKETVKYYYKCNTLECYFVSSFCNNFISGLRSFIPSVNSDIILSNTTDELDDFFESIIPVVTSNRIIVPNTAKSCIV